MDISLNKAIEKQEATRQIQQLIGMIGGIMADAHLNDAEIIYLRHWLVENERLSSVWPASVLHQKLNEVLADGVIDESERKHLTQLLEALIGSNFQETGTSTPTPTKLPIDDCVTVEIVNSGVCHTGEFLYGTRAACERLTLKAGGMPVDNVTRRCDILVVGTMVSPSWSNTSFGRKIEAAVKLQAGGHPIEIISERRWLEAIQSIGRC